MSLTYDEIHHQPASWRETLRILPAIWERISGEIAITDDTVVCFVGSGTSLYIAQTAAQSFQEVTGRVAIALPSSEVFLSATSRIPASSPVVAFIISRSGTTSEAILAADHLRAHFSNARTIGITCNAETELVAHCDAAIQLPHASERSVVMTKSFTTMLLALQVVAALVANDEVLLAELERLPELLIAQFAEFEAFGRGLSEDRGDNLVVHLGLGPNEGLAQEATLKLKEMTQFACEIYNPLEFRHGPISIIDEQSTVIMLDGLREVDYVADVRRDLVARGATVFSLGPGLLESITSSLQLGPDLSDIARCCLYLPPVQLHGYYRAVRMGLDPDRPRNLDQVVVLHGH